MATLGSILGGGGIVHEGATRWCLAVIDLDVPHPQPWFLELSFLGHALAFDPKDRHRAVVFEKKGPGAALLDLDRPKKSVTPLRTRPNRRFYGHGAFSADGSLLYSVEAEVDAGLRGVLVIRDGATLAELGEMPTHGSSPHDCTFVDGGRTLVVTNGGGPLGSDDPACVTWIDVASQRLLDRLVPDSPRVNTGHMAITPAGDIAVVSAPRDGLPGDAPGAITLRRAGQPSRTLTEPAEVIASQIGETLSVTVHPATGTVWATSPLGNMVMVWDLASGALRHVWRDLREPRGVTVTLDGRYVVLSHRIDNLVVLTVVDPTTFATVSRVAPSFTSGSHLFAHGL